MARIKTMRFDGRRFGFKVGISQIGVKEYFDKKDLLIEKLTRKDAELVVWQQEKSKYEGREWERVLAVLDRQKASIERRLRAVESRTWTPMESFVIDRPSEDEVNIETHVKGHILKRIEGTHDERGVREGNQVVGAAA